MKIFFKEFIGKAIFTIFYLLLGLNTNQIFAQDYPISPEVWSEPVRIFPSSEDSIAKYEPSLTKNLDTLYFHKTGEIYRSIKINEAWQTAERLSDNVNDGTPSRSPSISKDGKRIYYSAWGGYGGWDLWYNDWSNSLNDWGPAKNMGPVINSSTYESYLYEVRKDSIYTINFQWVSDRPAKYILNDSLQNWSLVDSFYYHHIGAGYMYGLSITKDKRKMYYGLRPWDNTYERGLELCVSYWDSSINNWGNSYYLNINTKTFIPDTSLNDHIGGSESYPWISDDGKILFFQSNHLAGIEDSIDIPDIYVSYLLVDENGDTVTSSLEKQNNIKPKVFGLKQNYPNPFNSSTKISYSVPALSKSKRKVNLILFDITGREVTVLFDGLQKPGLYELNLDASKYGLSSGIYFYQIKIGDFVQAKKMIYMQ